MKRKMLLALILILCLTAESALGAVSEKVLSRAVDVIAEQESNHNYSCVVVDTNGKLSVGFLQWNAGRAVSLVKKIIERTGADANVDGGLRSSDKAWIKDLITTDVGIEVQEEQAREDVSGYIETAMNLGIKDPNALCYYADIVHQVGTGAIGKYHKLAAEKAGGYEKITLEHMYQAALAYATYTKSRRQRVYQLLKNDPVSAPVQHENPASGISISPSVPQTMYLGETLSLKAVFEGAEEKVKWSSSNKKVASVSDGLVTPKKAGKVWIRVKTKSGLTAKVKLTVKRPQVSSLSLKGQASMKVAETQKLTVSFSPTGASAAVKWKSSNPKIVKVSAKGAVKALKPGKATISCREAGGKTASFQITVSK